ncbi:MAG TPA: electron transport complex subunit E [Epulopiscium sp.]|nr:electron transport complex subunit E [Candidatus Epulonipiscium sp.]
MKKLFERLYNGIVKENPIFTQVIGMCPTLAVTTSVENAVGMGLATTVVLICSNATISLVRKVIPAKIRIPSFVIIIASFVTIIQLLLEAYVPGLYKSLGIFLPLIVVNCLILARAEAYASKNTVISSAFDGLGMGLGFTVALSILGAVRELLGTGKILNIAIMPASYQPALIMIMAPGAFFALGILMALLNVYKSKKHQDRRGN